MNILLIAYFALFFYLGFRNYKTALWLFLVFLPVYFIKISLFGQSSNLLELTFFALFFSWFIFYFKNDWQVLKIFFKENKYFSLGVFIFLMLAFIATLNNQFFIRGLGHWRSYFLEPVVFFWILIARGQNFRSKEMVWGLFFASLPVSLLSVFQMITGKFIYTPEWSILAARRVTAFFTSPNAVALFLEMIFILAGVYFWRLYKNEDKKKKYFILTVFILAGLSILFSFSQGAWVALFAGLLVFLWLVDYKKSAFILLFLTILSVLFISPAREILLFKDKAGQNRLILWQTTQNYLFSNPKRFIFGTGLRRFYGEIQMPLANKVMEPLTYPHNIVLNFWSEIGFLGMLSFFFIYFFLIKMSFDIYVKEKIIGAGLICVWLVFFVHGLVDVPYFKNDLSFLFWALAALVFYFKTALIKKENA